MRSIAVLLSVALLGCFPHNAKLRRYSQLAEGASILAGIGMEYFANSDADCMATIANPTQSTCKSKGAAIGDIGLALILVGLGGFVATISTAQDDKDDHPVEIKTADPEKPAVKLPPGVTPQSAPGASGSASASAAPVPSSSAAAAAATP